MQHDSHRGRCSLHGGQREPAGQYIWAVNCGFKLPVIVWLYASGLAPLQLLRVHGHPASCKRLGVHLTDLTYVRNTLRRELAVISMPPYQCAGLFQKQTNDKGDAIAWYSMRDRLVTLLICSWQLVLKPTLKVNLPRE